MARHLIHVGWPKAGSTWLQSWFAAHPGIGYCAGGIAGYANVHTLAALPETSSVPQWRVTSEEGFILPRERGSGVVYGSPDLTQDTIEAQQRERCGALAELFPSAHILIVTRGFRAMILSSYSQFVRSGQSASFDTLLANAGQFLPWNYDRAIALYRAAFAGRVIVLPFELLDADPAKFGAELESRLGLAPGPAVPGRVNPSLSPRELYWYSRIARWLDRLPGSGLLRRLHTRAAFNNRLRRPITMLDRLLPGHAADPPSISDAQLERFRGEAAALAHDPLFRPYADAYLF